MNPETIISIIRAQQAAYAALVNALKTTDGIDVEALLTRLHGYADLLPEQPLVGQLLRAQAASLSGAAPDLSAVEQMLH